MICQLFLIKSLIFPTDATNAVAVNLSGHASLVTARSPGTYGRGWPVCCLLNLIHVVLEVQFSHEK